MSWANKKLHGKERAFALLCAGLSATLVACASSQLPSMFASEYDCSSDQVSVTEIGGGRYRVSGCDHTEVYKCTSRQCFPVGTRTDSDAMASAAPSHTEPVSHGSKPKAPKGARVERNEQGITVALDVRLDSHTLLKLRAMPTAKQPKVQFLVTRFARDDDPDECDNGALSNGERLDLPHAKFLQPDGSNAKYELLVLPAEFIQQFAITRKLSLKTCDWRWSLTESDVADVRHFAELYQEELAWAAPARQGAEASEFVAPPGGWPAWKSANALSAVNSGAALDGPALFKLLSPSVFKVIVETSTGGAQGSAVAVSTNQLLTNCHVLESAQKITLHQGKKQIPASIAAADPAKDRCILGVTGSTLTPIHGMRQRSELDIGEPLFTLGSPSGLELSLSTGVLSGVREEDGHTYVQTTAPISPGSSGGGLFDAHGNLVGITTLVLVGSERLNQSLNLAIPVDAFVTP